MPRKKKTPVDQIVERFETLMTEHTQAAVAEFKQELPDIIVRAFGLPTGDQLVTNHISALVDKAGSKRGPTKGKGSTNDSQKAADAEKTTVPRKRGRPKGSKNKPKHTDVPQQSNGASNGALVVTH